MKKIVWFGFIYLILGFCLLKAEQRNANGNFQTTFVAQDDGDSMRAFTVSVGTTTPVMVYNSTSTAAPRTSNYSSPDRILTIQNIQNFNLFCSTVSTVSATTGNRFVVFSTNSLTGNSQFQTYAAPSQIWCIFDPTSGSGTREILGWVGYDSGD